MLKKWYAFCCCSCHQNAANPATVVVNNPKIKAIRNKFQSWDHWKVWSIDTFLMKLNEASGNQFHNVVMVETKEKLVVEAQSVADLVNCTAEKLIIKGIRSYMADAIVKFITNLQRMQNNNFNLLLQ